MAGREHGFLESAVAYSHLGLILLLLFTPFFVSIYFDYGMGASFGRWGRFQERTGVSFLFA